MSFPDHLKIPNSWKTNEKLAWIKNEYQYPKSLAHITHTKIKHLLLNNSSTDIRPNIDTLPIPIGTKNLLKHTYEIKVVLNSRLNTIKHLSYPPLPHPLRNPPSLYKAIHNLTHLPFINPYTTQPNTPITTPYLYVPTPSKLQERINPDHEEQDQLEELSPLEPLPRRNQADHQEKHYSTLPWIHPPI